MGVGGCLEEGAHAGALHVRRTGQVPCRPRRNWQGLRRKFRCGLRQLPRPNKRASNGRLTDVLELPLPRAPAAVDQLGAAGGAQPLDAVIAGVSNLEDAGRGRKRLKLEKQLKLDPILVQPCMHGGPCVHRSRLCLAAHWQAPARWHQSGRRRRELRRAACPPDLHARPPCQCWDC